MKIIFENSQTNVLIADGVTVNFYALSDTGRSTPLDTQTTAGGFVLSSEIHQFNSYQVTFSGGGPSGVRVFTTNFSIDDVAYVDTITLPTPPSPPSPGGSATIVTTLTADCTMPAKNIINNDGTSNFAHEGTISVADGSFIYVGSYLLLLDTANFATAVIQINSDNTDDNGALTAIGTAGPGNYQFSYTDDRNADGEGSSPGYVFSKDTTFVTLGAPYGNNIQWGSGAPGGTIHGGQGSIYVDYAGSALYIHDDTQWHLSGAAGALYSGTGDFSTDASPKSGDIFIRQDTSGVAYYYAAGSWHNLGLQLPPGINIGFERHLLNNNNMKQFITAPNSTMTVGAAVTLSGSGYPFTGKVNDKFYIYDVGNITTADGLNSYPSSSGSPLIIRITGVTGNTPTAGVVESIGAFTSGFDFQGISSSTQHGYAVLSVPGPTFQTSVGTSFPSSPYLGQQFYRSDTKILSIYDGTNWVSTRDGSTQT